MKVIHSQIEKIWKTPKNKKEATTLPFKKTTLRFSYIFCKYTPLLFI